MVLCHLGVVWAWLWSLPISLLVVVAVLVILCHLVSNNRMKRKKNLHAAQETSSTSLGSLFLSARDLGPCLASVVLGVLSLPCVFSPFPPPVVHSHHCCIMSTIGIHNPPHKQRLTAVVLGAGVLFFCQMGRGRGLTWQGIPLLGSPGVPFCYPHIPAVCCCG